MAKAKESQEVQQSIGTPIEEGVFVSGNISVSGPVGQANLSMPIQGPDGKATIYLVAEKTAGEWVFSTLVVEVSSSKERIDLIEIESEE